MPAITLPGIPISDEQCIGDSLAIINNAFLSLSSNAAFADVDITKLYSIVRTLSTTNVTIVSTPTFELQPSHRNGVILFNNTVLTTVSRTSAALFETGHKTVLVQVNSGKVIFNPAQFNGLNNNTAITGKYGTVNAHYTGSNTFGWILEGDLKSPTDPIVLVSMIATPTPGTEDPESALSITGQIEDTFYYYPGNETGIGMPMEPMEIYVNGFYRSTVNFEEERLGKTFGYSIAGYGGTTPQVTSKFKEGRVDLSIDGGNPVFKTLIATKTPGSEDPMNQISITGAYNDAIFYYAAPRPTLDQTFCDVYVNGFFRTTLNFPKDRLGTQFGYKTNEFAVGAQATGTFVDEGTVFLTIPGTETPNVTDIVATVAPGTSNDPMKMAITAQTPSFLDTIASFPWPGQSAQPMAIDIQVNGTIRTRVDYTADRVGDKFWYRLMGQTGVYQAEGTFPDVPSGSIGLVNLTPGTLPTPTPLPSSTPTPTNKPTPTPEPTPTAPPAPTPTLFYLTAKPAVAGGTDDILNAMNIRSTVLTDEYNDTISYSLLNIVDATPADPMDVYVNGTHRTTVDFPATRKGASFTYRLANSTNVVNGVFTEGRIYLTISTVPDPTPVPSNVVVLAPQWNFAIVANEKQEDNHYGSNDDQDLSITALFPGDIIYGKTANLTNTTPALMYVNVNNTLRSVINYTAARNGTPFGYRIGGATGTMTYQASGTFADGATINLRTI